MWKVTKPSVSRTFQNKLLRDTARYHLCKVGYDNTPLSATVRISRSQVGNLNNEHTAVCSFTWVPSASATGDSSWYYGAAGALEKHSETSDCCTNKLVGNVDYECMYSQQFYNHMIMF